MQISPVSTMSTYWAVTATENARINATQRAGETTLSQADQRTMPAGSADYRTATQSATASEQGSGSRRATERADDGRQAAGEAPRGETQRGETQRGETQRSETQRSETQRSETPSGEASGGEDSEEKRESVVSPGPTRPDGTPLDDQEIRQLEQLKRTDQEVRQHERAHEVAGGPYTGSARYEYKAGPDGEKYAVAGEVPIDYGPVPGDPKATIDKMQTVIAAAMAPAEPSSKDRQVASQARQYLLEAKLEAAMQQSEMDNARATGTDEASRRDSSDNSAPGTDKRAEETASADAIAAAMAPDPASAMAENGRLAAASMAQPVGAIHPAAGPDPTARAA